MANLTTLDGWLSSWGPSASLFRWYVHAVMLNEAKDNNEIFPTVEGVLSCDCLDFSLSFLSLLFIRFEPLLNLEEQYGI